MDHFEVGDWVNFVRGIVSDSDAEAMKAHLESGCNECADVCCWLQEVAEVANASASVEVPGELVRRAEGIFEEQRNFRFDTLFPLAAHLALDGARNLQAIGIRSLGAVDHALYEAGEFTVDLRQETSRGSDHISLTGQISKGQVPDPSSPRFPVAVLSGDSVITTAISNQFGEFSLSYSRRRDLKLAIAIVNTGRKIEIPLSRAGRTTEREKKIREE